MFFSKPVFIGFFLLSICFCGCSSNEQPVKRTPLQRSSVWYKQVSVDIGSQIRMLSPTSGFAVSRGRGQEVPGHLYRFQQGRWVPVLDYPYSDSPLVAAIDSSSAVVLNHLVHTGNFFPVFRDWSTHGTKRIPLPKIMWDRTDHIIFRSYFRLDSTHAWIVGQQGHILTFDGITWKEEASPLVGANRSNAYEGDLNAICMTSKVTGWAVGRDGIIIHCHKNIWSIVPSPTRNDLFDVDMVHDSLGWIVGDKGTLLKWDGSTWQQVSLNTNVLLSAVRAVDATHAWIVGTTSTVLTFNGYLWSADESIRTYEDTFTDIDVVRDTKGNFHVWITGEQGIYTNSQSIEFSFTDITGKASLRRVGRGGIFFSRSTPSYPDLFVLGDQGSNMLYENNFGETFSDVSSTIPISNVPTKTLSATIGDINNDGYPDLVEVNEQTGFQVYYGRSDGRLSNSVEHATFHYKSTAAVNGIGVRLVDFDNDGNLDVYVSNDNEPDMLFRNMGGGRFTDVYDSSGITKLLKHHSFGATFGDFNNDGLIDIVIPYWISERGKCIDLFLNDGNFKFHPVVDSSFLLQNNIAPTVCVANDFNNDCNLDVLIHCQGSPPLLLLGDGQGHFHNVAQQIGLTTPIFMPDPTNGILAAGDVNNDGWIDFFIGSKLYINNHCVSCTEVSEQTGIQFIGHPAFADIDNDGDLDLFLGSSQNSLGKGDRSVLFRNNLNNAHFIKVRVFGDRSNRFAIGAKVFLEETHQLGNVGIGSSPMLAQNLSEIHFGVEPDKEYTVRVEFPSGSIRRIEHVQPGENIEIFESSFLPRIAQLAKKSIYRTSTLMNPSREILKCLFALIVIFATVLFGKKIGAGKFVGKWYFPFGEFSIYGISLHATILEEPIVSTCISFGILIVGGIMAVTLARTVIRKYESQFISHYRLLSPIGQGGMGKVFRAVDIHTKQIVALKILNPEIMKDQENRKRLLNEGRLLSSFSHPNIVKVFEVADRDENTYIAMEHLTGGTLKELLMKSHPVPIFVLRKFLLQICSGLADVHAHGIIHRDLKTGNIMLDADGNIRIMDFGLSKSPLVTTMTSLGTVLGTLGYVAPEQITNQLIDARTDIFSLGVVMYELVTNTLPFKGENEIALIHSIFNTIPIPMSNVRKDTPEILEEIVATCLSKQPEYRYSSVQLLAEKIATIS